MLLRFTLSTLLFGSLIGCAPKQNDPAPTTPPPPQQPGPVGGGTTTTGAST